MPRSIVLGLDGANWDLLRPWLDAGNLPNIASLLDDGVSANMESCLPPTTCPNWRCYSTGKNPGRLGVYWWERIDTETRTLETPNSRSFKSSDIWDYLNDDDYSVGIMNVPMTYPPYDIDGFFISGGPGGENTGYTHPPELEDELATRGYRLRPDIPITSKEDRDAASDIVDLIDERLRTFRYLLDERPVDLAHCTVFYVNVLQHFFWRGAPTRRAWEIIDGHVGAIREEYPDATLMLMSDHGCAEIETVFYVNDWLTEEGYQTRKDGEYEKLLDIGLNRARVQKVAARFGVDGLLGRIVPEPIKERVPADEHGFKREQKLDRVDWDGTDAIASGQGLVYTMDDDVIDEIIEKLRELRSPHTGKAVANDVFRSEDIYTGSYVDDGPDIVFQETPGVSTSGAIGGGDSFDTVSHWSAENVRTGLFLAHGPRVKTDAVDREVTITDVMPTILHEFGCAVPDDLDGVPLELSESRSVEYREPIPFEDDEEAGGTSIQQRLEQLGYLE